MLRLIEESISSAYSIVRQNPYQSLGASSGTSIDIIGTTSLPVGGTFIDLPRELFQMLAAAGPYLYRDTILLQKVIRSPLTILQFSNLIFLFLNFCRFVECLEVIICRQLSLSTVWKVV